jgi:hypothetical protein
MIKAEMSDKLTKLVGTADRVEAALERIAHLVALPLVQQTVSLNDTKLPVEQITGHLDSVIERLRVALDSESNPS